MSVITAPSLNRAKSTGFSSAWRWVLLLFPVVVGAGLLLLRQLEVSSLAQRSLAKYGPVGSFALTNQLDQKFGSENLAGKIWIADFVFTNCRGPCPIISSRMSELQKPLRDTDVHLVSFTVDPETDTPAVLRAYAEKLKAQEGRWDFLTGPKSAIYDLSVKAFKLGVSEEGDEPGQPVHSTRFVLVDRHGEIRGYYDALAPDGVTKVLADASHLRREQPSP
jgi:protein SCO1/2